MRKSNYEFNEIIKNVIFLLKTKMLFPNARLVRFPIVVRGKNVLTLERILRLVIVAELK